jgi:hypothetical protein
MGALLEISCLTKDLNGCFNWRNRQASPDIDALHLAHHAAPGT